MRVQGTRRVAGVGARLVVKVHPMRGLGAIGLAAALVASCGDAAGDTTTTSPAEEPTTSSTPATTTSVPENTTTNAPTTAASGACEGPGDLTVPAGPHAGLDADFDGDGSLDRLIGFQDGSGVWWIAIELAYGTASGSAVAGHVEPMSIFDFDGSLVGFARVDGGASTQLIGAVYWVGCSLYEATIDGSAVARFPLGGSVTHLDGMHCSEDTLTTASLTTSDAVTYEYTEVTYRWDPAVGDFTSVASSIQVLTSPEDDAVIEAATAYDC
jgi:hypothetical protein